MWKIDDKYNNIKYIEFHEIIFVYHDDTESKPFRININDYLYIIAKWLYFY